MASMLYDSVKHIMNCYVNEKSIYICICFSLKKGRSDTASYLEDMIMLK